MKKIMPAWLDPYRAESTSRIVADLLEESGKPLTRFDLAEKAHVADSWVWKCLRRLIDDGYVREAGTRPFRRDGTMTRRLPKLYERTSKAFSHSAPSPQELADVMNAIIRRNLAAKRK